MDNVIEIAQLLHPPHHLDPEIDGPSLGRETVPQFCQLGDDRGQRILARPSEQETGMDDDRGCPTGRSQTRGVVEHADRHLMLPPAVLHVTQEGGQRRVDGQCQARVAGQRAQALRIIPIHPKPVAEIDFAGVIAAFDQRLDRLRCTIARRNASWAHANRTHGNSPVTLLRPAPS